MAFRRYLIAMDASRPMATLDRYLAPDVAWIPLAETQIARARRYAEMQRAGDAPTADVSGTTWNLDWNVAVETAENTLSQLRSLQTRLATTDLFSPSAWVAVDADEFRDATPANYPERMRAFLTAPHAKTEQFVHYANREVAIEALRRASISSPAQIAVMRTAEAQINSVNAMAKGLADYFRALNLRPWGWAKYRARFIACWGVAQWGAGRGELGASFAAALGREAAAYGSALATWGGSLGGILGGIRASRGTPTSDYYNSTVFGPDGYDRLFSVRPVPRDAFGGIGGPGTPAWRTLGGTEYPNNWRTEAWWRCKQLFRTDDTANSTPSSVRFGSEAAVSRSRGNVDKCAEIGSEIGPTQCLGPSGDVFGVWLTNAALLGGGNNYDQNCYLQTPCYEHVDCVARSLADGLTTGPNPITGPWMCGAADAADSSWLYYVPPHVWYALWLWPMIEYLSTRDPLEVIYEVFLDVSGKNMWTSFATNHGERVLAGLGRTSARTGTSANEALAAMQTALGTAAAIGGTVNPMFGAVAGLGAAGAGLLQEVIPPSPGGAIDELGRYEPAQEYLAINPNTRPTYRVAVASALGIDGNPDGERAPIVYHGAPPSHFTSSNSALSTGTATVRITGMPHGGNVYVDGNPAPLNGRWTDDGMATWEVTVPAGAYILRVADAAGTSRYAAVNLAPRQLFVARYAQLLTTPPQGTPAVTTPYAFQGGTNDPYFHTTSFVNEVTRYADPGDAAIRVQNMPWFGAVYLDGNDAPADGAWEDTTNTVWVVPADPGRHTVRVGSPPPPDGAAQPPDRVATVDLAAGTASAIDFNALPTAAGLTIPPEESGLSTGVKVGIGLGIAGILVGGVYVAKRKGWF